MTTGKEIQRIIYGYNSTGPWYLKLDLVSDEGIRVQVEVDVIDVKEAFGRTLIQVQPVRGRGSCWVTAGRLTNVP